MGHILHGGNELTEVFFLVKSWLPPKNASPSMSSESTPSQEKGQRTQGGARGLPGTQTALLAFQRLGESHPSSGITVPALHTTPCSGSLGLRKPPGSGRNVKSSRAMGSGIAVQMLGARSCSQVWGSPRDLVLGHIPDCELP